LRVQIASGLLPLQTTLAPSVQAAPTASVPPTDSSSVGSFAAVEDVKEQTPPGGRLASLSMAGTTRPTEGQALQDMLQALHLFQHCDTYRTLPRAIQTLTEALAQQVGLALRSASLPDLACQSVPAHEEQDAQER
jgi:hypothetical protein